MKTSKVQRVLTVKVVMSLILKNKRIMVNYKYRNNKYTKSQTLLIQKKKIKSN